MLEVTGDKQGEVLEITTEGTATQDDLQTFKDALNEKKLQEEPVDILFIFKNIDGNTPKALLEAMKILPNLKDIHKNAIVADDTFVGLPEEIDKIIPGVEIQQYSPEELEQAREWIQA